MQFVRDVILEVHFPLLAITKQQLTAIWQNLVKTTLERNLPTGFVWFHCQVIFKQEVLRHLGMRKMQICSPEEFSTGTITASPSSSFWVSFGERWLGHWFLLQTKLLPSQESFLNHDPLKARGGWVIEVFKDCVQDCSLVHWKGIIMVSLKNIW